MADDTWLTMHMKTTTLKTVLTVKQFKHTCINDTCIVSTKMFFSPDIMYAYKIAMQM